VIAAGEALSAAPGPVLVAAGLLLVVVWRRCAPRLRLLGLAALVAFAAEQLHFQVQRASWERSATDLVEQKVRAVEARKAGLVAGLQRGAKGLSVLPEALEALGGGREERARLFEAVARLARSEPELALSVHDASLESVAWTGRVTELQGFKSLIPPEGGVFALEGTLTTTWLCTAPIRDAAGAIRGLASAELTASAKRHLSNEFLNDFDLLGAQDPDIEINAIDVRDPGEEAHPFPPLSRRATSREAILRSPAGLPLAAVRVTAPQPEHAAAELRARYRQGLALLACVAVVLWASSRRWASGSLALGATLLRLACLALGPPLPSRWGVLSSDVYASPFFGSVLGDALRWLGLPTAASWGEAFLGPLLRSPLDLFLTSAWTLIVASLLLARALRLPARRPDAPRAVLGSVLAFPILAGTFAWISDTVNNSPLDLAAVGLWPRDPAHLLVEVSLVAILGTGLGLLTATLALTCPMPATRAGRGGLLALWLVLGLSAERVWPRELIGLPLVSAVGLFLVGAIVGSAAGRWREALRGRSLEARAGLSLAGVALLASLLYPAVAHYSEKNVRQQIEHEHAPLVRRQPQWRDYVLMTARGEVDRMALLKGALPGPHPPGIEELAYAVWASTDLASAGLSSAVEIQDASGSILSRFAFNLPTLGGAAAALPSSESWSEAWETLPVGSAGRRVLHASRRFAEGGALRGAMHLYVGDDYSNLPFLSGKDPYSTLYRSAPRGAYRDRSVDLLVYGPDRDVLFSSADRPPALDPALAARAARPSGVWATLTVDGRSQHTFLFKEGERTFGLCYPRTGAVRFCADLAEAVTSLSILGVAALLLVVALRTLLGRRGLSVPSLLDAVERRFALRVFAAFVVLAVLPMGVLQVIVGKFVRDRFWKESDDQALDLAAVARKAVEDFAFFQRGESPSERPVTDAALVWVASLIRNDLDVFEGERVLASSKRELYASGLLPPRVSGSVYRALVLGGQPAFIGRETIGGFSYRVVSVPVSLGSRAGILSIPLALREREVEAALDDLDRTINLASVLFLGLAAALAHSMTGRISGPIQALTRATRRVALGDLAARVETRRRDELQGLVDAFNQMAGDLSRQRGELERSNRLAAWAEMARQVAHEVKNPLTPIQLSAEHLRKVFRDPGGDFPAALETCTASILRQVQILRDIATEFSAFARPPSAAPEPVDLGSLARDVVRPYEGVLPSGVRLRVVLEGTSLPVLGDRRLLERALVNLIENALQAVGERGEVSLHLGLRDSRVEVAVDDTGPGISPEVRARAFEPFFSTKTGGSGLGLALVKKIAEDHGGGVALENPAQGGARALLWLPAAPGPNDDLGQ
jgi:signal transduction histidine kinase